MKWLKWAALLLPCVWLAYRPALARTLTVQPMVVCADQAMGRRISAVLNHELTEEHYTLGAKWPAVRLVVFAVPDIANRKDPQGWSIAVAHAAFAPLLAALEPIAKSSPDIVHDRKTQELLTVFMHSTGLLTYLNVINVDHLDAHNLPLVVGNIVNSFRKRWPPTRGAPPRSALPQEPRSFSSPPAIIGGTGAAGSPP